MLLEHFTWPEVKALNFAETLVMLPLGSFEQHGHHLPLTTDTDLVTAVARGVEKERPKKILCLPTLWPGHSTHHLKFPGTLSISQAPYIAMIRELASSMVKMGSKKVFFLNGHGGNDIPMRFALRELKTEFPQVTFAFASYWTLAAETLKTVRESELGGMGHACEMETSLMLHLHPEKVRMALAKRDGPKYQDIYRKADMQYGKPIFMVEEFHEISGTGTVGHPDLATAEKGERFYRGIVSDVVKFTDAFGTW